MGREISGECKVWKEEIGWFHVCAVHESECKLKARDELSAPPFWSDRP